MFTLFRLLARFPLPLLHAAGVFAGWLTWILSGSYRRRLHAHAAQAGVPAAQARAAVGHTGRMVAELPLMWARAHTQPLGGRVRWEGVEHIEAALAAGRGLLLLTPHLGSFEVVGQAYAERFGAARPMTAMYRPPRKAWLRPLVEHARARPGLKTAPASVAGVRQMIRALRAGECVAVLPDQVPPEGMGTWAPFFGREAYTMTLAARLVQQTGCAWLPVWVERLPGNRGWCYHVHRPQDLLPAGMALAGVGGAESAPAGPDPADTQAVVRHNATVINRAMEAMILQGPGQYLWAYHRYKAPRPGEAGA